MVMNQMLQFIKQMSGKINDMNPVTSQADAKKIAYMRNLQRELKQKDVLNTPFKDLSVVVFDIETTGFYPYNGDTILSIGAIKMKGAAVLEDQLFYKTIYNELPPSEEIAALTGITGTELEKASALPEVLRQFFQFVHSDTLIAHHSSHEKQFMKHATWTSLRTSFQHRVIDTSFLIKVVSPDASFITLDEWCDYYGVDIGRRHHALYDAAATAKLWSENVKRVEEMGFTNLKDIYTHIASLS
ncbi:exonuclease domain-containing protein [Gracilibacillus sp. S3-1-1]|uniref:Exonuclease domain-containing protein n=1 Tax=Gracilibacillus pellucidus TaxID=3095368 RepID=A0ACC6M601_9BACI|nr:exonuclease domain-containing protein [Gracilibacillus sp. S3-1-1]MDX8046395.1 exonuclease domain-containing protein [Gracilibacillus sp. S3-1-1]